MPSARSKAYTDAGVDINAGNALISRIKGAVAKTYIHGVRSDIGGFGGLFRPDLSGMADPVLVSSTDGVGTKLKLAFAFDKHDTVGIDLVAMSVNDILVLGAKPLFFLDYYATGTLDLDCAEAVISGIAEGCRIAGCALLGGETAEMPDMYARGEYDLAGFCIGIADNDKIIDGHTVSVGDAIIGIASSGPHANGYSLIRKILGKSGLKADDMLPGCGATVREILLTPTRIYGDVVRSLLRDCEIKGMVHVTGGGFYDNIPRVLPASVQAAIAFASWEIPPVFHWIKQAGGLSWPEMLQVFNCGIGYMLVVSAESAEDVVLRVNAMDVPAWILGNIAPRKGDEEQVQIALPSGAE
ncbi:MAG: phosphoribosylformylglycinamidine cyclo-ligase [Deltaproteobacteria bacterium]|nr:phosphoribosylformylglycinamidine cyclo-ligase [Deltaproteobacteria bacterium]